MRKPIYTDAQKQAFEEAANPHQWFLTAESLHDQAVGLYQRRTQSGQTIQRGVDRPVVVYDNTNKATLLLCALALENAIKAFLVYENPDWVSEGYLHSEICSHKLVALSEKSRLIPYRTRDSWVLAAFERGNESWMRYPCGRRADDILPEQQMPDRLWLGYQRVMRGYGAKLIQLLGRGWTGLHGFQGSWDIHGEWLGGGKPIADDYVVPSIPKGRNR